MANLIQTVMGAFTPNVTTRLADALGESPSAVTGGLGAATPALLAGALQRSASPAGARTLLEQIKQTVAGGNPLDDLGAVATDESARASYLSQGQNLASSLLGAEGNAATSAIASHSAIGMGSASKLLGLAAPLVMGAIARMAGPSPTASGLQTLLSGQRASILGALPPGLGSLFGLGSAGATRAAASAEDYAAHAVSSGAAATTGAARAAAPGTGRFLPWVIAALVLVGLLFAVRNCAAQRKAAVPPPAATTTAPNAATTPAVPTVTLNLPGGEVIHVQQGSIGFDLANFLASPAPAPKTFTFDNLNYDTASHALTAQSAPTVSAISAILKAYPDATVRVVGYTDNQGAPAANKTLSEQRAQTVKSQLVAGGVAADRIETSGMGEANAIADNSTDAGRATNRRTELVVIKK